MLALAAPVGGCAAPTVRNARLGQLEAVLAAHASATAALEQWCAAHRIAPEARVTATTLAARSGTDADIAPDAVRRTLAVGSGEALGFRHVRLDCGGTVLSEAYNWYVPALLTPEMNAALAASRTPFGKVAAPLGYRRELIDARRGVAEGCPPGVVLSHRAMLRLPDGRPLALLVECYTAANMAN